MKLDKIIIRKSDGILFRPSYPDSWTDGDAIVSVFSSKGPQFYFRGVRVVPPRWWQRCPRWEDTGEIWQPESGEFKVEENVAVVAQNAIG